MSGGGAARQLLERYEEEVTPRDTRALILNVCKSQSCMFFVQRRRLEALCAVALRRHAAWQARREALQALLHVLEVLRQLQSAI